MLSRIDLLILGLLLEKPMHGYEINQNLVSADMKQWIDVGMTSIYYSLARLKKNGLVVEAVERETNKPRSVFHLTNRGREEFLEDLRRALEEQERLRLDYNIALFFINKLNEDEAIAALERRKDFLEDWVSSLEQTLEEPVKTSGLPTLRLVIEHTRAIARQEVAWLGKLADRIGGKGLAEPVARAGEQLMALSGNLKQTALSDVVQLVAAGSRTGTLVLSRGKSVCTVSFREGQPVYVASSSRARVVKKKALSVVEGKAAPGALENAEEERVAALVIGDFYETFRWPDGLYVFDPSEVIEHGGVQMAIGIENMILEGCRQVDTWEKIRTAVRAEDMIFDVPLEGRGEQLANVSISKKEEKVLEAINGVRDVQAVAEFCGLSIFEASKILYGFAVVGLVTPVGPEKADVLRLFNQISRTLLERFAAVAGGEVGGVEKELNLFSTDAGLPFFCKDGVVREAVKAGTELIDLVEAEKKYLHGLIQVLGKHVGRSFTSRLVDTVIRQLSPNMSETFARYGFEGIRAIGRG